MLYYLTRILKKKGLFKRERRSTEIRALAIVLYFSGLSFRDVSKLLKAWASKSLTKQSGSGTIDVKDIFNIERKRRSVAIDETVIKAGKRFYYVWVAVDVERMEVISARISRGKGNLECYAKTNQSFY